MSLSGIIVKLHILSDLHIEFAAFDPPPTDADVVILAGDIHVREQGLLWARTAFTDRPVLYVAGNHEYYGRAYPKHLHELKEQAEHSNVTVLENDSVIIGDIRFMGCTLWTDFRLHGDPRLAGHSAAEVMTDYRKIRIGADYRRLRPTDTAAIHRRSRDWLKVQLSGESPTRQVVISHHAPSPRSIPAACFDDPLSSAYASRLDDFIESSTIDLWIHGHLHNSSDYRIGQTRIVANPRGYPDEANPAFKADFTVEL